ncbi:MAG: hypothetical protein PHQ17_06240 [Methanobacterium sp.]|jgi:hypothetical protein|nr:hypothetical protein [Methanobacterium sp.]
MIKIERTCSSLKCDVVHKGELIGKMEGVSVTQWFMKNHYNYTGAFSRFVTDNPELSRSGITVDIVFNDRKIVAKEACIEWIRGPTKNGTFSAKNIEYADKRYTPESP